MNNWAKLLHKENLELRKEAQLLKERVKLMKKIKNLKQDFQSRRTSSAAYSNSFNPQAANFTFSVWGSENPLKDKEYPKKAEKKIVCPEPERPLLESFESYYESEEENIDKSGKCELSYLAYKVNHTRGSRRNSRHSQISDLSLSTPKTSFSGNIGKSRRSSVKSTSTLDAILNNRPKNCGVCDELLYKGLPSNRCRKHNLIN